LNILSRNFTEFVPDAWRELAYSDTNIVLDDSSCMLFPGMEARMLQALNVQPGESVLELGTGCAYMTAMLADLSGNVLSLDTNDFVQRYKRFRADRYQSES
jgi:protein-L-isoaspartate(D-aspartate) O-methyltransferase